MKWDCPACGGANPQDIVRCICGYEAGRSSESTYNASCEVSQINSGSQPSTLLSFGVVLLIFGLIGLGISLSMKTSVETGLNGDLSEVNNLGLLNDKQNYVIVSTAILIIGAAMIIIGAQRNKLPDLILDQTLSNIENDKYNSTSFIDTNKSIECPLCAETIKAKAIKCRFCGHILESGGLNGWPGKGSVGTSIDNHTQQG